MRISRISALSLICFIFTYHHLSVPSFAEEKNAEEYLKENHLLAEKNPESFVKCPYLGASIRVNSANELIIEDVRKGSPADKAGIKLGDVVMQIDGIKADKINTVYEYLSNRNPAEDITVSIKRKGKIIRKHITLGLIYVPLTNSVLGKIIFKNIPIRLAIIFDEIKSYIVFSDPRDKEKFESSMPSMKSSLSDSLETTLSKDSVRFANFSLIDRQKTEAVIKELNFSKSGLVSTESQRKLGKILGATHLSIWNVTLDGNQNSVQMTMINKLVEVDSGQILATSRFDKTSGQDASDKQKHIDLKNKDEVRKYVGELSQQMREERVRREAEENRCISFPPKLLAIKNPVAKRAAAAEFLDVAIPKCLGWSVAVSAEGSKNTVLVFESVYNISWPGVWGMTETYFADKAREVRFEYIYFIRQRYNVKQFDGFIFNVNKNRFE
jgi:hypothetical protein